MVRRACTVAVLSVVFAGCVSSPFDPVAARFRHRVPFEVGRTELVGGNRIEIVEVWGTRPTIQIGGDYLVVGRYHLESADRARVTLYETTNNWTLGGSDTDLLSKEVERGSGDFALVHSMPGPGSLHVSMYTMGDSSTRLANVYFGTGDNVLR